MRKLSRRTLLVTLAVITIVTFCCMDAVLEAQQGMPPSQIQRKASQKALGAMTFLVGVASLAVLFFLIGVALLSLQIWARLILAQRLDTVITTMDERPGWQQFIVGAVNLLFLLAMSGLCGRYGTWRGGFGPISCKLLSLCFLVALIALVSVALAALSQRVGQKLLSLEGTHSSPLKCMIAGWLTVYLLVLVPLLGWVAILYMVACGSGAVVMSFISFGSRKGESAAT